jgi:hypothetical protein
MATKHDLINMAIKKGNVLGILILCLQNKDFTDICKNEEKVQKQILKFFSDITDDNQQLHEIVTYLIFKSQISNESKLRDILNFIKDIISDRNIDTNVLIQLIKLLRYIETRKNGGWIYVNYKPEQDKLYSISGEESSLQISTNDDDLLKKLFNNYFKVFSDFKTQQIYQL